MSITTVYENDLTDPRGATLVSRPTVKRLKVKHAGRLIALATLAFVGVAVWFLLVIVITGERGDFSDGGVGVSRVGDTIVIESCVGPIGDVTISKGTDSGTIVWSATPSTPGAGLTEVPVASSVAGYAVSGAPIDPGSTKQFAIQTVDDVHGSPFMSTILPFVPASLRSGRIMLASGDGGDLATWRASSNCK